MEEYGVKFIIMRLAKCRESESWLEKVWRKLKRNKYDINTVQKLKYQKKTITLLGRHGLEIELPYSEDEAKEMPKDFLEAYIRSILDVYDISGCYLSRELNFLNGRFDMNKKWIFQYLFFERGMSLFLDKCGISKKYARFVVIDSGNRRIETILQILLEYANYLTIVTSRVEYFQNAVDVVYQETGLVMSVVSSLTPKSVDGNVVINLNRDSYQIYGDLEENACVIDLEFTEQKLSYLTNRRKDLNILYDYEMLVAQQDLDKELVAEILVRDNWKLSRFMKKSGTVLSLDEINFILQEYHLELDKIKTISFQLT